MRKALVIGIDDYPTMPLAGCVNDATAVAATLETDSDGTPNFDVVTAMDVQSKGALKNLIRELFRGDSDIALLYFSGHGHLTDVGGYVVTPDYTPGDEGVSMDEILSIANGSSAKDKIIILDCCHSGTFGSLSSIGRQSALIKEGIVILTASRSDEPAMEVNGYGVFTNLLLDALRGGAANLTGHITPGSVYSYIDQALGPWSQRPVFKTNVTRFTSLRKVAPPIPTEVLRRIIVHFPNPNDEHRLDPAYEPENIGHADPAKTAVFADLQKMARVGLVIPVEAEHMYFAAQNSKSCKLTPLGYHYWRLVKDKRV